MPAWPARVVLVVSVVLAASLSVAAPPETDPPTKLSIIHWWTSPSEAAALSALVKGFSEKYPEVTVVSSVAPHGGNTRHLFSMIRTLESENQTPDTFQMYGGYATQVFFDGGLLSPIDDLWAADKLEDVIPKVIRDMNKLNGHYYSVPVNVHRTNVIWYNKALLDRSKIDPDTLTTWDAFFRAAETLKAGGVQDPIQVGVTWTQAAVLEGIVASQGIGVYQDWINGKITAADDPRLIKAFETFARYLTYVNKDHESVGWDTAVQRVKNGEGAFCLMGDWADGEFRTAHLKYGKDYGAFPVPGTQGMFGLGIDTFQHPRGAADPKNSYRWLSFAASRAGQDAFNPLKGSSPARTDADVTRYDAYQRLAIADLKATSALYPTIASAVPESFRSSINSVLSEFTVGRDVNKAARKTAEAAKTRAGAFTRNWSLK
jgi:glucose/mannose transport system substrate-binding protein